MRKEPLVQAAYSLSDLPFADIKPSFDKIGFAQWLHDPIFDSRFIETAFLFGPDGHRDFARHLREIGNCIPGGIKFLGSASKLSSKVLRGTGPEGGNTREQEIRPLLSVSIRV
ncbi:hypothetical protein SBDP1_240035 [Syntrophobacter sp. SbD1]|nr:hypothetical protein SBDP1_240035 [Syntrophobacter sp. SbD1]